MDIFDKKTKNTLIIFRPFNALKKSLKIENNSYKNQYFHALEKSNCLEKLI